MPSEEPFFDDDHATYTDGDGRLVNSGSYEWSHSIGEIVTAVLNYVLRIDGLTEHN